MKNKIKNMLEDDWVLYLPFYDNYLHRLVKAIDDTFQHFVMLFLGERRLNHKCLYRIIIARGKLSCL